MTGLRMFKSTITLFALGTLPAVAAEPRVPAPPAAALSARSCAIIAASADETLSVLSLEGTFLCTEPTVFIGTAGSALEEANVVGSSDTFIDLELAAGTAPGTYLANVQCGGRSCFMDVTIGATGPQGIVGPQGPQGDVGPQDPQGPAGPSGNLIEVNCFGPDLQDFICDCPPSHPYVVTGGARCDFNSGAPNSLALIHSHPGPLTLVPHVWDSRCLDVNNGNIVPRGFVRLFCSDQLQ